MNNSHKPINDLTTRGFTLLEIMIAILILAIGLAAMANLQGKLTRYSTIAKQRTTAMNLAEQQIETMRSFYTMQDTGADVCSIDQTGFDDLGTCTAGATVSVGNMPFTLSWTVVGYSQDADGTTAVYGVDSDMLRADMKLVTIHVAWVDGQGDAQAVELVDIVDATSIFNTGRVSARVDSNIPPKVPFEAEDFQGIVEIALGADKLKGSTTPKPQISNKGENVITQFDVVTFLTTADSAYLQRREEFKVVNCLCTMDAGLGTGREPTIWDGAAYALGEEVYKRTGSVVGTKQPDECEMCCNDHHDASTAVVKYDAFRPAFTGDAGTFNFNGDHAHYQIVNGVKVLAGENDEYLEACRYIRKDGWFRLTTDLALENMDVVQDYYPTTFNTQYSNSIINFVTDFSEAISVNDYPLVVPAVSYSVPWWLDWWGIFLSNMGVTKQAVARTIYIDYISEGLLKKIKCLQGDGIGAYSDFCDITEDPPWLEILPFYDVDVTSLANWNNGSMAISVTNSPISDIDRFSFSRGEVEIAQQFDDDTNVIANIELSNTGLTDTNPIDPDDEVETTEDMPVQVRIGGTPPANGAQVIGDIYAGSSQINVETVRLQQNKPPMDCEIITIVNGNSSQKAYVCDLYEVPVVNGTVTVSDYNATKVAVETTVLNRKVCTDSTEFTSVQVVDDNTVADPDLNVAGETTVFTFSNLSVGVTMHITIVDQEDACP